MMGRKREEEREAISGDWECACAAVPEDSNTTTGEIPRPGAELVSKNLLSDGALPGTRQDPVPRLLLNAKEQRR
jgi:hypothetical protein